MIQRARQHRFESFEDVKKLIYQIYGQQLADHERKQNDAKPKKASEEEKKKAASQPAKYEEEKKEVVDCKYPFDNNDICD